MLSALLLARLMSNVTESLATRLDLEEPRCFTDSQVALFWIKGTGRDWKPFVQNRVNQIHGLVPVEGWAHCSGKEYPTDIAPGTICQQVVEEWTRLVEEYDRQ